MSSITRNIIMAAAMSMATALRIQAEGQCPEEPVGEKRWKHDDLVFDGCDQSVFISGGVYEMRLQCNKYLVITKHEDGKAFDLKAMKIEHDGEIGNMKMQRDGNLVVYSKNNEAMWHTNTYGNDGASLYFQDDGNLVIYESQAGACKSSFYARWASETSLPAQRYNYFWDYDDKLIDGCGELLQQTYGHPNKAENEQYKLKLNCQSKALEILYSDKVTPTASDWGLRHTFALDRAGPNAYPDHLIMEKNGNLVVYSTDEQVMWASDTEENRGAFAEFQDDGNFTVKKHQIGGALTIWESGLSSNVQSQQGQSNAQSQQGQSNAQNQQGQWGGSRGGIHFKDEKPMTRLDGVDSLQG